MGRYRYGLKGPTLVLGDLHFPEANQKCLDWVYGLIQQHKPAHVVQIGDLYDFQNFSKYAKTLNYLTPAEELAKASECAGTMWRTITRLVPKADCHQLLGNHDNRAAKRLLEKAPELEGFFRMDSLFRFKGVTTHLDEREEVIIGDICFMHGFRKHGEHARYNQMSTVCGHTHRGGVVYYQNMRGTYWELNVGFLGDVESPVFRYRNQRKLHGWTNGCGFIDDLGPRFMEYKP